MTDFQLSIIVGWLAGIWVCLFLILMRANGILTELKRRR